MGKKRQSSEAAEEDVPVKKEKILEFNGTVFKNMLKDATQAMKGLEKFVSTAKKLPNPDLYDVVEGYIKISMECAEIFKLMDTERQIEGELMLIFESLEMILLRTASDLSHFNTVGNAIVKKTVSSHMKSLLGSLHSSNHRFVRQCLNFLSALVAQGPEAAREVFSHLHSYKAMSALAKRRDKLGKPDVRMAFIQFVLSFLVSGDNATVGQILEVKEFLPEIFSSGLKEDRLSIVNLILSTLKSRVVLNKGLSKTQKVRFFTPAVLSNLASLYKWNGIVDAATEDDSMEGDSQQNGVSLVRDLVHTFLVDLCCSRKHGISFHDSSFGTAGRAGNLVLLQFLVGLRQAADDSLMCDLLVSVLKTSPDVLSRYFKETQHSFSPRLKSAWQDNVNLMKKIYEAQTDISTIFQAHELVPAARLVAMIHVLSLPPVCNKAFFTQGLNLSTTAAQLTTFSVMSFVLKRANKNLQYLQERAESGSNDAIINELVQLYRESLSKILPDMTTIVGKWQSLSKKEKTESDETKKVATDGAGDAAERQDQGPESAEVILLKALILQVICLYQRVVPHLVGQCKFDFSKLLKGILSEKGLKEEVPPVLQCHVLQLALELPSSKFSWFRLQEAAEGEASEKSVLFQILNMFVNSSTSHLKTSTKALVLKVLKDSGVFEFTWTELELWLEQLTAVETSQRETVIHFLEKVLVRLVSSSHIYTDKVASLVQEAAYLQANVSGHDGDAASVPVSHIDDVLDMLDVIMESSEGEMEEFEPALSEDLILQTFPFSALVPAALEARNKLGPNKDAVHEYLSTVLTHVLHSQRDPLPLCLTLLQFDKELQASAASPHAAVVQLQTYYTKWLPPQSHEELFKPLEIQPKDLQTAATFSSVLKELYIQGSSALNKDDVVGTLGSALESTALSEFPVAIKQTLLYVKSTVDHFGSFSKDTGKVVLENLLKILQLLVTKLLQVHDAPSEPAAESLPEESELFLEVGASSEDKDDREKILMSGLSSILKHPTLQLWFLALELSAFPAHSLKPVSLKQLCSLLTNHILSLLKTISPRVQHQPDLLKNYSDAIVKAVHMELSDLQKTNVQSQPMQALLSLHNFMDFSDVKEIVSKLLLLPQTSLFCSEGTELTVYGQAALQILTQSAASGSLFLSQSHLSGLGTLLLSCSSGELEAFLLQTLSKDPGCAKLIHTEVLLHCLQQQKPSGSQSIACVLLQNCAAHRLCFELWCLESGNMENLVNNMDTYLHIVKTYLQLCTEEDPARPKDVKEQVLKMMKHKLFSRLSLCVTENFPVNNGADYVETLSLLIKLCADANDVNDLCASLPDALKTAASLERWRLVDVIAEKLVEIPEEAETWRKSVLTAALVCLKASYSHFKDAEASQSEQEQSVLDTLHRHLMRADDVSASDWNSFVKTGLKYRYRHGSFLTSLSRLVEVMYEGSETPSDLLPLATLHMMSSSHSMFLPSLLDHSEDDKTAAQSKEALVSLLLSLVKKCPSVCNMNHFVVLLGAYGASLSSTDQKLLLLLQEYERNDVSLLKFQSFVWGPAAVEHHKAKKSLGSSLWKQTSTEELLALLKPENMIQTIAHFPQQRRLIPQDHEPLFQTDLQCLYDPRFLLPLFSAILRPESVIDCLKFVSSYALGLTAAALSSYDPKMRAAAFHVLTCFYKHLEGARFKEKKQLQYLMDTVKNSVRQQNQRLPFVHTMYISKVLQQMLKPEDHMYIVINRFLLSHQSLDFRRVPEFFKLFYGFDLEHKLERDWILNILEEGISDRYSYELCEQQGIFQSLLGFCSSPLCDDATQAHIMGVLSRAATVTQAAYNLSKVCGLLSWIIQLLDKRKLDQQLLGAVIELVHSLWLTNLGQKEKQLDQIKSLSSEARPEKPVKCLPLSLICEFICVASTITKHLRLGVKTSHFSAFVQTYSSVLNHYVASLDMSAHGGRLTLRPEPLSSLDALSLLHCWSRLHHDPRLVSEVNRVTEKHQLKELFNKGRVKGFHTRSRKEKTSLENGPDEANDQASSESQSSVVSLCAILCHWSPMFSTTTEDATQPQDQVEPSHLANDTALLIAKFSLRSLLETPSSQQKGTKLFLHWLDTAVKCHKLIIDELAMDTGLKADLLRLYHRVFESNSKSCRTEMTDLRLFTKIMIRVLETRDELPQMHRAVVSSCFTEEEENQQSIHDAGLFLSSLYIHDAWSHVPSAQMFMSHVRSVTKHTSSSSGPSQCPVRAVCQHIISSTQQ